MFLRRYSCRIGTGGGDTLLNMSDTDLQLLARYRRHRAEDAFAELVRRYVDLVHSAALRQVRSPQLAEEVAQSVFLDLARQANQLAPDTIVAAWLYEVTRRTAIDVVRREARRQLREQTATEMNSLNATAADWSHIEPLLDEAMHALDAADRAAVLLRYFENKSLREVGTAFGTSDDTAQKRVSRAVDRLREFFAKRGVAVGASGLAVVLSANAVQAAPVGLGVPILSAASLLESTFVSNAASTAAKTILMTTSQKAIIATVLTVAAVFGINEARRSSSVRTDGAAIQASVSPDVSHAEAPDVMKTTASGLRYQVIRRGTGIVAPAATNTVEVHYHGTLVDGTVFESSMDRGRPLRFPLDTVIPGWTEGIQLMKPGDIFRFEIPPNLGYEGARMRRSKIPPNSTLVFEIELLRVL